MLPAPHSLQCLCLIPSRHHSSSAPGSAPPNRHTSASLACHPCTDTKQCARFPHGKSVGGGPLLFGWLVWWVSPPSRGGGEELTERSTGSRLVGRFGWTDLPLDAAV